MLHHAREGEPVHSRYFPLSLYMCAWRLRRSSRMRDKVGVCTPPIHATWRYARKTRWHFCFQTSDQSSAAGKRGREKAKRRMLRLSASSMVMFAGRWGDCGWPMRCVHCWRKNCVSPRSHGCMRRCRSAHERSSRSLFVFFRSRSGALQILGAMWSRAGWGREQREKERPGQADKVLCSLITRTRTREDGSCWWLEEMRSSEEDVVAMRCCRAPERAVHASRAPIDPPQGSRHECTVCARKDTRRQQTAAALLAPCLPRFAFLIFVCRRPSNGAVLYTTLPTSNHRPPIPPNQAHSPEPALRPNGTPTIRPNLHAPHPQLGTALTRIHPSLLHARRLLLIFQKPPAGHDLSCGRGAGRSCAGTGPAGCRLGCAHPLDPCGGWRARGPDIWGVDYR